MSDTTAILQYVQSSGILPNDCLILNGRTLSDLDVVKLLVKCLDQSINDRFELIKTVDDLERYLLERYNDIYQEIPHNLSE